MSSLAGKQCVPCQGDLPPLTEAEAKQYLKQLPGWEILENATWLKRKFTFKNFKQAIAFVNKIGEIAEKHGHHPDITFGWGYAEVRMQTHKIGGLHENDFIVATEINELENK